MVQVLTHTLYRTYRPQSFDEVIGQREVVEALRKQIESGSIAHAYLFSGGRGTGKTSIARIFARELGTSDTDMYEIDAASNRGINEIRELRDGVSNLPFESPYKVYIIDEVHMLTKEAFNALLKTLEEPPAHVVFILATTEKHKVLDTILSRCQVYNFTLAVRAHLVELVQKVAAAEGRTVEEAAAEQVAALGKGSFRDTLSHLQKVFALHEGNITLAGIEGLVGHAHEELEHKLVRAISDHDQDAVFDAYHKLTVLGVPSARITDSLLGIIRSTILLRHSTQYRKEAPDKYTPEQIELLSELRGITSHTLRHLLEVCELVHRSAQPAECLELFLHEQVAMWTLKND